MTAPESPSAFLTRAASLMRERAAKATAGPWEAGASREVAQSGGDYSDVISREVSCMSHCYGGSAVMPSASDAAHIASWHPLVAVAVAAWLEMSALEAENSGLRMDGEWSLCTWPAAIELALEIARAYLGGTP